MFEMIDVARCFERFTDTFSPKIVGVLRRDATVTLGAGQFCIVPRGVEHRVVPRDHVKLMLFEPAGIAHTGAVESEITLKEFDRLDPS